MSAVAAPLVQSDAWRVPEKRTRQQASVFQSFVNSDGAEDDLEGLVAFALYEKSIREEAAGRESTSASKRRPSPTTVKTYRGAAQLLLESAISRVLKDIAPALKESALLDQIRASEVSIKAHIDVRNSSKSAIWNNLVAWAIGIALTFLLIVVTQQPDMIDRATKAFLPAQQTEQLGPPTAKAH